MFTLCFCSRNGGRATMMIDKKAFNLLEIMLVMALFSVLSLVAFQAMRTLKEQVQFESQSAAENVRDLVKQDWLLSVGAFENISPMSDLGEFQDSLAMYTVQEVPGKHRELNAKIDFLKPKERISIQAKLIDKERIPEDITTRILNPPIVNYSGEIELSNFPLKKPISIPDNPLGTYFRYTVDGSDPTEKDPVWALNALTLADWSPTIALRAFNEHPHMQPSKVVYLQTTPKDTIEFTRESGRNDSTVSFSEIKENRNRLVLANGLSDPSVKIYYQVGSHIPQIYQGPFHVPLNLWTQEDLTITFWTELTTHSQETPQKLSPKTMHLNIAKAPLPPPVIESPENSIIRAGSIVTIVIDQEISQIQSSFENLQNYPEDALEYIF